MEGSDFAKEWALKWAEGTILGFARGRIELNRAHGMLKKAEEVIGDDKLLAIIMNIEGNPIYLPYMTAKEKATKLEPLKRALKRK